MVLREFNHLRKPVSFNIFNERVVMPTFEEKGVYCFANVGR